MLKKKLLGAVAVCLLALAPFAAPMATHAAGSTVIHGITFPTQTNGCTGPIVPVYGSSALKSYILAEAKAFCTSTGTSGPDVEYASGGDSCPGVDWAAAYNDNNELGVSDVYAPSCTGAFAPSSTKIVDNNVAVNVVESIAQCGTANEPQGGSPHAPTSPNPCAGSGTASNQFAAPNDESVNTAQLLWNAAFADYAQLGGVAGVAPTVQQRSPGSGTRITWCYNIFGPGNDSSCTNNSTAGPAGTTGTMLNDVCGNPYAAGGPAAPVDPAGTVGYSSRAGITVDPRQPAGGLLPVAGCGIFNLNGHNGYNQNCDPTSTTSQPYQGTNTESGALTCNGDLEVATGNYLAWGYEHLDYNSTGTTAAAQQFVNYINSNATAQTALRTYGFMQGCQMLNTRSTDGGPYTPAPGATC